MAKVDIQEEIINPQTSTKQQRRAKDRPSHQTVLISDQRSLFRCPFGVACPTLRHNSQHVNNLWLGDYFTDKGPKRSSPMISILWYEEPFTTSPPLTDRAARLNLPYRLIFFPDTLDSQSIPGERAQRAVKRVILPTPASAKPRIQVSNPP